MKKMCGKKIIFFATIVFMLLPMVQVTKANIFDDFLGAIGLASESKEIKKEELEVINKEVEEYLDSRQKEVVTEIEKIYDNIQNMDIDAMIESIDYKIPRQTVANVKEYFNDYENGLNNAKSIAGTLKYKIESVTNTGNKVIAKITYSYPSVSKLITKVLPEIILKNAGLIFGNITNDTLDSALNSIKNELQKGVYEVETFTRDFTFEKIGDKWKMVEVDDVVKDLTKYVNDISKNLFK